ncbi:MAG: iron-containing alcohol dehydrogenase [Bacillales bacterium]
MRTIFGTSALLATFFALSAREVPLGDVVTLSALSPIFIALLSLTAIAWLAHALGALFGLSHGRANAILLPYVIQFNAGLCDGTAAISPAAKKYASIAKMLGLPCSSTEEGVISLVAAVKYLQKVLDIPETLAAAGVDRKELDDCMSFIIKSAREDVCTAGNPKEVRPIDFTHLLNWVYEGDQ